MTHFEIPSSRIVKINAKTALRNGLAEAIISVCLWLFSMLVSVLINSVFSLAGEWTKPIILVFDILYSVFVSFPLFLGALRYFWRLTDGIRDSLSAVFYYFSSGAKYRRAIKLSFVLGFRIFTVLFVCMLPYALISIISESEFYRFIGFEIPLWVPNLVLIRSFLYIIGLTCTVFYVARYYLVPMLVVMDEELLLLEAVHISCMVSKRSLTSFLVLILSLAFWILASVLILPAAFTLPVVFAAYAVHSRFAMTNYNLAIQFYENNSVGYYDEEK